MKNETHIVNTMKKEIYVTTQFVGFHCWPEAPEEVSFLRTLHRHVFHVKVFFSVTHGDRQLEFFISKKAVEAALEKNVMPVLCQTPSLSCEMIGHLLGVALGECYVTPTRIEVSEDGENGAICNFEFLL